MARNELKNHAPQGVVFEALLILVAAVGGWLFGHSPVTSLHVTGSQADDLGWRIGQGLVAALPPLAGMLWISRSPLPACRELRGLVERLIGPLFAGTRWWEFLLLAVAAGVGEELLFRGLIQEGLASWCGEPWGMWIGITVASVLFALGHALNHTYLWLAFFMSWYLGWLLQATGSLLVPMVAHAAYDWVALWYLLRCRPLTEKSRES